MTRKLNGGYVGNKPTVEYSTFQKMKRRCLVPQDRQYQSYGGRGITTICDRWRGPDGYVNFLADMGPRPTGTSLDRIDNHGNYEPSNCRWATPRQQANNRRGNRALTWKGITKNVSEWARDLGVDRNLILQRLKYGWPPEAALSTPSLQGWRLRGGIIHQHTLDGQPITIRQMADQIAMPWWTLTPLLQRARMRRGYIRRMGAKMREELASGVVQ